MTKENLRRLYAHYLKIGYKSAIEDLLKKKPWLKKEMEQKDGTKPKG